MSMRATRFELCYKLCDSFKNMVRNLLNIIATSNFHTTRLYKYTGTRLVDSHLANVTQELNITRLHSSTLRQSQLKVKLSNRVEYHVIR